MRTNAPSTMCAARAVRVSVAVIAMLLGACGTAPVPGDAGPTAGDAAIPADDAAIPAADAAMPGDAGPVAVGRGLAVHPVVPIVLVDTRAGGACGERAPIDATHGSVEIDLGACGVALPPGTGAAALSWTILPRDPASTFTVRVGAPKSIASAHEARVGPLDDRTRSGIVALDGGLAIRVEVEGTGTADVLVELTALFAPPSTGARGVVMLPRPVRLYAARWDAAGVWHGPARAGVDERLSLNEVEEDPLGALPADVVGLIGVAHVAPDGLCEPGSSLSIGPARPEGTTTGLVRVATCGPESTFPSRSSTAFVIGASPSQQIVLRADGADAPVDLDVVGYLVAHRADAALYHVLTPRLAAEITLGEAGARVGGAPPGAIAISGHVAAIADGWGVLTADALGEPDGPSGPFATLALRRDAPTSAAFTTALDETGAFVLEADAGAQLSLVVDGYWALDAEAP